MAISETGHYSVLAFDDVLRVYRNHYHKKKVEEISDFQFSTNKSKSPIVALFIMEKPKIIVAATGGKCRTLYVVDFHGNELSHIKLNISDPDSAFYDKIQHRIVIKSSTTALRIFRIVLDNFDEFKKVETEFLCTGHSGKVLDGSFSSDGTRLASISTD